MQSHLTNTRRPSDPAADHERPLKLLCLCDSPTVQTGFGRVAANLLKRWHPYFEGGIDVWAINYTGQPHPFQQLYRLFPANNTGTGGWERAENFSRFLKLIQGGEYTHVFPLQDTFQLSQHGFPLALKNLCDHKGVKTMLYYPVDAALEAEWTDIVRSVDVAVAYTEYGRQESLKGLRALLGEEAYRAAINAKRLRPGASLEGFLKTVTLSLPPIHVLPHGSDPAVFHPVADRPALRAVAIKNLAPGDFLMVNVNANQRRKDTPRSLQLLAELKERWPVKDTRPKLILHMSNPSVDGVDLEVVGRQLGLKLGEDWTHNGQLFASNWALAGEDKVNTLYNLADLVISTSLGEGWGLSITEAIAAGAPVATPDHTSCAELAQVINALTHQVSERATLLPVEKHGVVHTHDNSRVRPRVDVEKAAGKILEGIVSGRFAERVAMPPALADWLSWDRIAGRFLELMDVAVAAPAATPPVESMVLCEAGQGKV
jgi:glycosyltransferase involved in cell wall biosynthesis